MLKKIFKWLKKLKTNYTMRKAAMKLQNAVNKQAVERKRLRKDINTFLREYFGIDANSKYIPKDFKNREEVRIAVSEKFKDRMANLNVKFTDLFK